MPDLIFSNSLPDPSDPRVICLDCSGASNVPIPPTPEGIAATQALKKLNRRWRRLKPRSKAFQRNVEKDNASLPDRECAGQLPRKKRGAQPGNTNALTHGFYASRLPSHELEGLDETAVSSLKDEIDVMRVFSRKVAELGAGVKDLEQATGLLRVLSLATTSINRLVRTHSRIPDPLDDPAALLRQALLELEEEWPELKAFGDQFRDKSRTGSS